MPAKRAYRPDARIAERLDDLLAAGVTVEEAWKVHPAYRDYEVSDQGRVRRLTTRTNTVAGRVLRPHVNRGYRVTRIGGKEVRIHVMVLETFVGPRPDGHWACHADDDKENNGLANLRWAPYAANYQDWAGNGGGRDGTKCYAAKLTEDSVVEIRQAYAAGGTSYAKLAALHGVDKSAIALAVKRHTWKHV